jgi:hypothetical protein
VVALGSVDIFVRSSRAVNPYFHLPTFGPPDGWWKVWFFLRNDTDVPLPVFTGSCPVPQPKWGTTWPRRTSTGYNPCVKLSSSCYEEG